MIENTKGGIVYDGLFGASNPCASEESTSDIPVG
jgi:hypothetical protein